MDTTKQFHTEFDRIYKLIHKENALECFCEEDLFSKIKTLHYIFTTKNGKGKWLLEQGCKNLKIKKEYVYDFDIYRFQRFVAKYVRKEKQEVEISNDFIRMCGEIEHHTKTIKTLRDLFLQNCIPSNDPEQDKIKIENLKLI